MATSLPTPVGAMSNRNANLANAAMSFLTNSSFSVKIFLVCVFVGYVLSFKEVTVTYLSVIPGKLLPPNFHIWTLITHSFVEVNFLQLFGDSIIIILSSRMIEPLWGVQECIIFYFIITVSCFITN